MMFTEKSQNYKLYLGDNIKIMDKLIEEGITVNLTVTSPPYDNLRNYQDESVWNYQVFTEVADRLIKLTKEGGIIVWVVGDACLNGGETGSSFKQALYFKEHGMKLHDTMIYEKNSSSFPARRDSKRYTQIFEYMFVFTKGKIRDDITLLADKPNKWAGHTNWGKLTSYTKEEKIESTKEKIKPVPDFSLRNNIWKYTTSIKKDRTTHPAIFPEQLAEDHIKSWSNEGDIIFDPFMGSGTTGKMALLNKRKFIGIEIVEAYYNEAKERIEKYFPNTIENEKS